MEVQKREQPPSRENPVSKGPEDFESARNDLLMAQRLQWVRLCVERSGSEISECSCFCIFSFVFCINSFQADKNLGMLLTESQKFNCHLKEHKQSLECSAFPWNPNHQQTLPYIFIKCSGWAKVINYFRFNQNCWNLISNFTISRQSLLFRAKIKPPYLICTRNKYQMNERT